MQVPGFRIFPGLYFPAIKWQKVICLLIIFFLSSHFSFSQNSLVKQWDYRYGGTDAEELHALQQTADKGFILGGDSRSAISGDKTQDCWGERDFWIVKTDSAGIKLWDRRFGGTQDDGLICLQQTVDGGYILGGFSESGISGDKTQPAWNGSCDFWIVKTDSSGDLQWDKRFGGTGYEFCNSVQQTKDGGYIVGGDSYSGISGDRTQPSWGAYDYWIVKTDSLGNFQWDKRFGGTDDDYLHTVQQTADAGFILSGYSESGIGGDKTQPSWGNADYWMVKTDSLGNLEWDARFGGGNFDYQLSSCLTADKGYILGGISKSGATGNKTQPSWGGIDYWAVKTDSSGNIQWDASFGGTGDEYDFGNISQTSDGGYLMPGTSHSDAGGNKSEDNLGGQQMWIVKTDGSGALQWDKTIFTTGYDDELGYAIQTADGCYIMANRSDADSGGYKSQDNWGNVEDYWFAKFCVVALPQSNFASSDTFVCEKFCVSYFDSSANDPVAWQWLFPGGIPSSSSNENPANICYNNPGTYDVTLITQNAFGTDTATFASFITVYPTPPIPVIVQSGNTLTSDVATTYQWQFNSIDIPGATNQSYTAVQTGSYTIIIADSNGCVNASTIYVEVTGIDESFEMQGILIYPNPSGGRFTIEWMNNEMKDQVVIRVMNVFGKVIFYSMEKVSSLHWKKELDPLLASGIYFIEIADGERIFAKRKIVIGN